jgi:hypothetical protein
MAMLKLRQRSGALHVLESEPITGNAGVLEHCQELE